MAKRKWLKRWRRYKHAYKGDLWSKQNPDSWKNSHGSGWKVVQTMTMKEFGKK